MIYGFNGFLSHSFLFHMTHSLTPHMISPYAQHMPLIHHGISEADEVLISNVIIWYKTDMEHYSWWFSWCIFSLLIISAYYINKISKCFIKFPHLHSYTNIHTHKHTHTDCSYCYYSSNAFYFFGYYFSFKSLLWFSCRCQSNIK